jgi:antitoxin YefM
MKVTNYTDFRLNMKKFLDSVGNDNEIVVIKRHGDKSAVLISLDNYNRLKTCIDESKKVIKRNN